MREPGKQEGEDGSILGAGNCHSRFPGLIPTTIWTGRPLSRHESLTPPSASLEAHQQGRDHSPTALPQRMFIWRRPACGHFFRVGLSCSMLYIASFMQLRTVPIYISENPMLGVEHTVLRHCCKHGMECVGVRQLTLRSRAKDELPQGFVCLMPIRKQTTIQHCAMFLVCTLAQGVEALYDNFTSADAIGSTAKISQTWMGRRHRQKRKKPLRILRKP